jgi:hypothetical protein
MPLLWKRSRNISLSAINNWQEPGAPDMPLTSERDDLLASRFVMTRKEFGIIGVLLTFAHSSIQAQSGTTVTLRPALDTSIHSSGFNPRGDATILAGKRRSVGILDRGLLRFDLAAIPTNATVESATMRLQIVQVPIDAVFAPFELHRALKAWAADASWTSATTNLPWSAPGAEEGIDYAAALVLGERVAASSEYVFASTNQIIADIAGWIADPASNHGWLLKSANEGTQGTAIHFGASESAVPPALEIHYTVLAEAPVLREAKLVSTNFTFEIHGSAGASYDVQTRAEVDSGSWTTFTNFAAAAGQTPILVTVPASDAQRYFRVMQH